MNAGNGNEKPTSLPPIGGVIVLIFLTYVFLQGPVVLPLPHYSLLRWLIATVCIVGLFYIFFQTYINIKKEGLTKTLDWLLGGATAARTPISDKGTMERQKVPPLPQRVKDELILERADRKCEYCEDKREDLDVHHIQPRSEGGTNRKENLIVLCPSCHSEADKGVIPKSRLRYKLKSRRKRQMWE